MTSKKLIKALQRNIAEIEAIEMKAEERAALIQFAEENGRTWKSKLRHAWETGQASAPLQSLRNASYFGPRGLIRCRLTILKKT